MTSCDPLIGLMPAMDPSLYLASHVRACAHGGQVILLDLRCNRYLGVASDRYGALASRCSGWPDSHATSRTLDLPADELATLAAPLLRQGLLTLIKPGVPADIAVPEATQSLNADDVVDGVAIDARQTLRFIHAGSCAALSLRWRSLQSIAQRVKARRLHAVTTARRAAGQPLRATVASYLRLRPLMFSAHDRCLHDSLSLLDFLAPEGWYPSWVIGVATQPFRAHAWVQSGDLVISDLHENVRGYTPILSA